MKKILSITLCLFLIFLTTTVSAFDFDNTKNYDPITRNYKIKNAFGLGDTLAELKLNTPLNVIVGTGYQKVAEFTLYNFKSNYGNAFQGVNFYQADNLSKKIPRNFDYKYLDYQNIQVPTYKETCTQKQNKTTGTPYNDCKKEEIGFVWKQKKTWVKFSDINELPPNQPAVIGIFTNVKVRDYIEWVPKFMGKELVEWASWTQNLNVNLSLYWKMNDTTVKDELHQNNGSNNGASVTTGIIENGLTFEESESDWINLSNISGWANENEGTISFWMKPESYNTTTQYLMSHFGADDRLGFALDSDGGGLCAIFMDNAGGNPCYATADFTNGSWFHVVHTWNSSGYRELWVNNIKRNTSSGATIKSWDDEVFEVGRSEGTNDRYFDGDMDELYISKRKISDGEIGQLYNNGTGITWTNLTDDAPNITLNFPLDNANYSTSPVSIDFNCSASDDRNLTEVKLLINDITDQTNASGINDTDYIFTKSLSQGNYNWTCEGFDNASQSTKPATRNITIDSEAPRINITSPTGTIDYLLLGNSLNLSFIVTDIAGNLDTCLWDYNGSNNSAACSDGVQFNTTIIQEQNNFNVIVYANDTQNFNSTNSSTWSIKFLEHNNTYNNQTAEGSFEDFLAFGEVLSGLSVSSVNLIYNGTSTSGESFEVGNITVLRKQNFNIPSVNTNTNISFYWTVTLSDSTEINLSTQNQTIFNLDIDNCSSYTNQILNFTVVDEETQLMLSNTTIETANNIYSEDRSELVLNFSVLSTSNPTGICLNINITSGAVYSLDTIVRYETPISAIEYYNIVNSTLSNTTTIQDIILYDLNLSDSTEFQLTFTGSDFLFVENALVHVDRQYISENQFKTVELPKTDFNGQAVLHLVRNDVIYNIRITKGGVVLGNFENKVAFCDDFTIGDCNIELNAFDSVDAVFNYDEDIGIIFTTPTYNATSNKVSFNFLTEDGESSTVRLEVTRNDIFGNRSVCNSTLTSSGGTLICNVPATIEDSFLKTEVSVDGILALSTRVDVDSTNYGVVGYLIMFIMAIALCFMFVDVGKSGVLISLGITLIGSISLGLMSGEIIGFGASGLWLLIVIIIGIIKLNKERQQ